MQFQLPFSTPAPQRTVDPDQRFSVQTILMPDSQSTVPSLTTPIGFPIPKDSNSVTSLSPFTIRTPSFALPGSSEPAPPPGVPTGISVKTWSTSPAPTSVRPIVGTTKPRVSVSLPVKSDGVTTLVAGGGKVVGGPLQVGPLPGGAEGPDSSPINCAGLKAKGLQCLTAAMTGATPTVDCDSIIPDLKSNCAKDFVDLQAQAQAQAFASATNAPLTCPKGWAVRSDGGGDQCVCDGTINQTTGECVAPAATTAKKEDKTTTYVLYGVGAVAVLGIAYLMMKKGK